MLVTISGARQMMGPANTKYSDKDIEQLVNVIDRIGNFAIDSYIQMKRQRKEAKDHAITTGDSNGIHAEVGTAYYERKSKKRN